MNIIPRICDVEFNAIIKFSINSHKINYQSLVNNSQHNIYLTVSISFSVNKTK